MFCDTNDINNKFVPLLCVVSKPPLFSKNNLKQILDLSFWFLRARVRVSVCVSVLFTKKTEKFFVSEN